MKHNPKNISDNQLNAILDEINEPRIKEVVDTLVEKHPEPPPGEAVNKQEWQENLRKNLTEFFNDKRTRNDWIKAFDIISDDLSRHLSKIEYHEIQNEWKNSIKTLESHINAFKSDKSGQPVLFEKQLNEMCGISETTLAHFYEVGLRLYNQHRLEEAEVVFRLIAMLNTLKENVWISLGLCQKQLSSYVLAIFSFAMAIVMNPENVLSYIHSAECYLELNERNEAKECLISAQEMLEQEKGEQCQVLGDFVQSLLKQC